MERRQLGLPMSGLGGCEAPSGVWVQLPSIGGGKYFVEAIVRVQHLKIISQTEYCIRE